MIINTATSLFIMNHSEHEKFIFSMKLQKSINIYIYMNKTKRKLK